MSHDEPPRIVSETPVGGKPQPIRPPITVDLSREISDLPILDESAESLVEAAETVIPESPVETAAEVAPVIEESAESLVEAAETVIPESPVETVAEIASVIEETVEPPVEVAAEVAPVIEETVEPPVEPAAEVVPVIEETVESPVEPAAEVVIPETPPAAPAAPSSKVSWRETSDEQVADRKDWDDDMSPELAAVLFGGGESQKARAAATSATPAASAAPVAAPAAPVSPELPAEPITLTDVAGARTLAITAQGISSPAPEAHLTGKARHTHIEEPLPDDQGQRVIEHWEYLKSDWPSLAGRLVRRVFIEEVSYADGSWRWVYERSYSDNGKDRREVRANKDHTLIERADEIAKKDPATGKRIRRKEFAAMIHAAPPVTDKPGFFSRLLGKKPEESTGPKSWRPASADEIRAARKRGGSAF